MLEHVTNRADTGDLGSRSFRAVAVVDWVSFVVRLARTSHGGYLKRTYENLGVSHADPLNAGAGGAATEFRIRLQHPDRYQVIRELLDSLDESHGLCGAPTLGCLEMAVDFLQEGGGGADLTKRLMTSIRPPVIVNPRLANRFNSVVLPSGADIDVDMSLYVGNKGDDLLWRVYWKRTDETFVGEDGKRVAKPLHESEWRARAEVCIQGATLNDLGLTAPGDLEGFRFESLHSRGYFKFCRPAEGVAILKSNPYARSSAAALGVDTNSPACVLGMFARRDARRRSLQVGRYLTTDTELTEAVRQALRGLTRRF